MFSIGVYSIPRRTEANHRDGFDRGFTSFTVEYDIIPYYIYYNNNVFTDEIINIASVSSVYAEYRVYRSAARYNL